MRVEVLGDGPPEVAVVGGIHGDEPCGVKAVEHLLGADLAPRRPVALVIANEEAIDQGVRYVERDLNRAFPPLGTGEEFAFSNTHEGRLARELFDLLEDTITLALHSTRSHPHPFSVVVEPTREELDVCARLPVDVTVDSTAIPDGRLLESTRTVEVEAGYQGSQAAVDNAIDVSRAFLSATGVLDGPAVPGEKDLFRVQRPIPKRSAGDYDVFARNFELVRKGEPFAAVEGELLYAERDFYPVLLSAYGYEDLFGYEAERTGTLTADGRIVEAGDGDDEGDGDDAGDRADEGNQGGPDGEGSGPRGTGEDPPASVGDSSGRGAADTTASVEDDPATGTDPGERQED